MLYLLICSLHNYTVLTGNLYMTPLSYQYAIMVVLIITIRPSLDFQQIIWSSTKHANTDNFHAQGMCVLVPNLEGAACDSNCHHRHKPKTNCNIHIDNTHTCTSCVLRNILSQITSIATFRTMLMHRHPTHANVNTPPLTPPEGVVSTRSTSNVSSRIQGQYLLCHLILALH